MSKVREILLDRRKEIEAEIAPLRAELKEIDAALAAISGGVSSSSTKGLRAGSIGAQALAVLGEHPNGLRTREIVRQMRRQFGREIAKRNMSWHLSHLKRDGHLIQTDERWRIAPSKDETPGGEPSASVTTGDGNGNPPFIESKESHDLLS